MFKREVDIYLTGHLVYNSTLSLTSAVDATPLLLCFGEGVLVSVVWEDKRAWRPAWTSAEIPQSPGFDVPTLQHATSCYTDQLSRSTSLQCRKREQGACNNKSASVYSKVFGDFGIKQQARWKSFGFHVFITFCQTSIFIEQIFTNDINTGLPNNAYERVAILLLFGRYKLQTSERRMAILNVYCGFPQLLQHIWKIIT
jgi:hypothetical protein